MGVSVDSLIKSKSWRSVDSKIEVINGTSFNLDPGILNQAGYEKMSYAKVIPPRVYQYS